MLLLLQLKKDHCYSNNDIYINNNTNGNNNMNYQCLNTYFVLDSLSKYMYFLSESLKGKYYYDLLFRD